MKKFFLIFLINFCCNFYFSQSTKSFKIPDSLSKKSFKILETNFNNAFEINPNKASIYANSILLKGKKEKDRRKTADAYLYLFKITFNPAYLDSMIVISKKSQDLDNVALGYLKKGNYFYFTSDYAKSLENYLQARDFSKKDGVVYNTANFNVGFLKLDLGNYQEAKKLFLNYKKYLENRNLTNSKNYVSCLYSIAYIYSKTNKLDLSDSYVKLGLRKNTEIDSLVNYSNLMLVSGINQYKRKDYLHAAKILENVSKLMKQNSSKIQNLALSEFYAGMSFYKTNNIIFLDKFKTVDSIIIKTKNADSKLVEFYPILIEHYKKAGDKEKQLFYIEHFLEVNRILNKNSKILAKEINKKYDIPILLKEKENLISDLNSKNSVLFWISGIIGFVLIILIFLYFNKSKKTKYYQQQAVLLAKNSAQNSFKKINKKLGFEDELSTKLDHRNSKTGISEEILNTLYLKFESFEKNKDFLNKDLSLESLAKEFKTNRDYLSKAVNEIKGKSFSQYINEQRIAYLVEELKTNPHLQKLTIAGIAEEVGFSNTESFTNSFKKLTGTLPSFYLKALKNI
ncbi:helix-turn-helix domain-containing protein [Halpernia sp. GG3]